MNDDDFETLPPWMKKMLQETVRPRPRPTRLTPPPEIAYLVGGPADGMEQEVSAGVDILRWSEYEPSSARSPAVPSLARIMHVHEYRPCFETGEWLWQGVR